MEDKLPPVSTVSSDDTSNSLDMVDANAPVSSYSVAQKTYPVESLEVHSEGESTVQSPTFASARSIPFSRRKATIVSLVITIIVVVLTGVVSALFISKDRNADDPTQGNISNQDISLDSDAGSALPELQGSEEALLINGDLITRGKLKVVSDSFVSVISAAGLTADQTISMPNASGTLCLDSNNCNYAEDADVAALQAQLGQIVVPEAFDGVDSLNGQNGSVTIQGSLNRVNVTTVGGVITLSTPQALDANANVQFASLTLGDGGQIISNGLSFVDNGRTFSFPAGGLVSQEICTNQGNCGGGGGSVSSLNAMTGAITIEGTANQINVVSGAGLITLSTPQDIAVTSSPTFGGLDINGLAAIGSTATINSLAALELNHTSNVACGFACTGLNVTNTRTANSNLVIGVDTGVVMDAVGAISAAGLNIKSGQVINGGSIGDNYGIRIATQTAGVSDYGVYVQGADTYAIWADAGLTRLDGGLEVQGGSPLTLEGATDNTFETTIAVTDPTADNTITLPNASGTVCLTSNNCGSSPVGANYLVTALDGTLTNERAMLAGSNIAFTDGGAGGNFTIATVQNPTFTTSVTTPILTSTGALAITPGGALTVGATSQTALLQGSNTTITSNGAGNDVTLTSADQVVVNATTGGIDLNGNVAAGNNAAIPGIAAIHASQLYSSVNCGFGCFSGMFETEASDVTVGGITGVYAHAATSAAAFILPTSVGVRIASTTLGAGSTITDNYGLQVLNQTAGVNDYGVYIQGADTYALWVDSGISRFDGNLEFEGATDDAFEFTLAVADPTADRTYTIPNSSAASDTFCLLTLNNCAGTPQNTFSTFNAPNGTDPAADSSTDTLSLADGSNITVTGDSTTDTITIATVQNPTFTTSVTSPLFTSTGAMTVTPGGAMTLGSTGQTALLQGTTTTITSNGAGNDININSADAVVITTGPGGTDINGSAAIGNNADISLLFGLNVGQSYTTACAVGCYGINSQVSGDTAGTLTAGYFHAAIDDAGATSAVNGIFIGDTDLGAGATLDFNYGINVANLTAGNTDIGVYIGGADTYALFVDNGISRFDGNLEFEGATDDAFEFTLAVADPTADVAYRFVNPSGGAGTYDICTTDGNCAGVGGGITGAGTAGRLSVFTGAGSIGNSSITDNGSTVTLNGNVNLDVQGTTVTVGVGSSRTGSMVLHNSTNNNTVTIQSGTTGVSYALTLPTAVGATNQCLKAQNGTGSLFWDDCEGGAGGTSGVTSLNTLSSALTIQGTANRVSVSDNGTDTITLTTPQDIHTGATPTFAGLNTTGNITSDTLLRVLEGGVAPTFYGIFDVGDLSADQTFTFLEGGTVATSGNISTYATTGVTAGSGLTGGGTTGALTVDIASANGGIVVNANDIALTLETNKGLEVDVSGLSLIDCADGQVLKYETTGNTWACAADGTGAAQNLFETINAPNGTDPVADSATDALNLADGNNITVTGDSTTDTITIATVQNPTFTTSVTTPTLTSAGALNITPGGPLTVGATGQTALLQGSAVSITSNGVTNDITLTSADQIILNSTGSIALNGNTDITGALGVVGAGANIQGAVTVGTASGGAGSLILYDGGSGGSENTITFQTGTQSGDYTVSLPANLTGNDTFCMSSLGNCFGSGTGNTLQAAYDAGNIITTTDNRNIAFTLADTTTDADLIVNMQGTGNTIEFQDGGTAFFTAGDGGNVLFQPTTNSTSSFNVKTQGGGNMLTVDTINSRVGINLGANTLDMGLNSEGLMVYGGITIENTPDGGGFPTGEHTFVTPGSTSLGALLSIPTTKLDALGSSIALGVHSTSDITSAGLLVIDDRLGTDLRPAIALLSPGESNILGFTFDGQDNNGYIKTLNGSVGIRVGTTNSATFSSSAISLLQNTTVSGTLSVPHTGSDSERFGAGSSASGTGAVAVGFNASAGNNATALGWTATAGSNSTAIGHNAQASSAGAVAIGSGSVGGSSSVSIGNGATSGSSTVSIGQGTANSTRTNSVALGQGAILGANSSIAIGVGATTTSSGQMVIGGASVPISQVYVGDGVTSATPDSVTLQATGGNGTDIAGANFTIAGGKGTGNSTGGSIQFQTSDAGASGTILQGLSTKATLLANGNFGIGDTTPAALFTVGTGDALQVDASGNLTTSGEVTVDTIKDLTDFDMISNGSFYLMLDNDASSGTNFFDIYRNGSYAAGDNIFSIDEGGGITTATSSVTFLRGYLRLGVEALSRADAQEIVPGSSFIELTCTTGTGCTLTLDEDASVRGQTVRIINVGTNTVTINDASGSAELAGNWATVGQWDSIDLIYAGADGVTGRWVELSRSDN